MAGLRPQRLVNNIFSLCGISSSSRMVIDKAVLEVRDGVLVIMVGVMVWFC